MELSEEKIEDLIYESPWILDERFVISKIAGSKGPGRQVNVGRNGVRRDIDLLFKDTRDNRPVIVELKKTELLREHIAQILGYRALIASINPEGDGPWVDEFGYNYHSPKMILIGTDASEETEISANLAGIDIRRITGIRSLDISKLGKIEKRVKEWNAFRKAGIRTLIERDAWIRELFDKLKTYIDEIGHNDVYTCNKLYETKQNTAYLTGFVFPFINFPISYKGDHFLGLYEYDDNDEDLPFSEKYIYCDFWICDRIVDEAKKSDQNTVETIATDLIAFFKKAGHEVTIYKDQDNWVPFITIDRDVLEDDNHFRKVMHKVITDGLKIADMFHNYLI